MWKFNLFTHSLILLRLPESAKKESNQIGLVVPTSDFFSAYSTEIEPTKKSGDKRWDIKHQWTLILSKIFWRFWTDFFNLSPSVVSWFFVDKSENHHQFDWKFKIYQKNSFSSYKKLKMKIIIATRTKKNDDFSCPIKFIAFIMIFVLKFASSYKVDKEKSALIHEIWWKWEIEGASEMARIFVC